MVESDHRVIKPWNIFEGYFRRMPSQKIAIRIGTMRWIILYSGTLISGKFVSVIAKVNFFDESYDLLLEVDESDEIQGMFHDPEANMLMLNVAVGDDDYKSENITLKIVV